MQKPEVVATHAGALQIDGELDEWASANWTTIAAPADGVTKGGSATGSEDISASFASMWSANGLYLAVEVADDTQHNDSEPQTLWEGDSVQVAFDMARNGGTDYDSTDDYEFGYGLTTTGQQSFKRRGPAGSPDQPGAFAVVRQAGKTRYEALIDASAIGKSSLQENAVFGFSLLVNDNDGNGRDGYVEWSSGIGAAKIPGEFGEIELAKGSVPDAGSGGSASSPGSGGRAGASAAGSAGSSAAGADAGISDAGSAATADDDDQGCGCRLAESGAGRYSLGIAAFGALALVVRRRRADGRLRF